MVSVIVPSYGGFDALGFHHSASSADHFKYQHGCASSNSNNTPQSNTVQSTRVSNQAVSSHFLLRRRKLVDPSKGHGGPPLLRSPPSASLYKPLYVDCSVEYELPNVPKVPSNSLPLLVIHPGYEPKKQLGRKREPSIHSSSSLSTPVTSSSSIAMKRTYSDAVVPSVSNTYQCGDVSESHGSSPPAVKRSRPSGEWLRAQHHQQQQQRRLCEQQQMKRYHQQQQFSVQQQQQQLWPQLSCCPPLIQQQHHSWANNNSACTGSNCCTPSNKLWLQQQLYAKQQQQQQAYYQQQQLLRSAPCPDCFNGKCLFAWNKENIGNPAYTSC